MNTCIRLTTLGLMIVGLAGCGSAQTGTPAGSTASSPSPQASQAPSPAAQAATAACDELQGVLSEVLKANTTVSATTFRDLSAGVERAGCQLAATGSADQVGQWVELSQQLSTTLTANGWSQGQPLADGPTGTVLGFTKELQVAQLTVDWQPSAEVSCPVDQPISACDVPFNQQQVTVNVAVASTHAADAQAVPETVADEEALKQAVHTYVMENTSVRSFSISIDAAGGHIARVRVTSAGVDPMIGYVREVDGGWSVVGLGAAFDADWLHQHAIPQSLWLTQS